MIPENVRSHFRKWAKDYDAPEREKIIPGFDDFYQTVGRLISPRKTSRIRILELGAGTGMLTERVLFSYPSAGLTWIDLTDERIYMIAQFSRTADRCLSVIDSGLY